MSRSLFTSSLRLVLLAVVFLALVSGPVAHAQPSRVVILGDSLTSGFGLLVGESFPAVLQRLANTNGYQYHIVPYARSGDTAADGLDRALLAVGGAPSLLVVALGGNDILKRRPFSETQQSLLGIVDAARAARVPVLLAGLDAPPTWPPEARAAFRAVFQEVAAESSIVLIPSLLAGVAGVPALNQEDGVHPNAAGARRVAANLWPTIVWMLDRHDRS